MKSKELCETLDISYKSLRVYEEEGLIKPKRDINNYRNYDEGDLLRIREIMLYRTLGFSIKDIKEMMKDYEKEGYSFVERLYNQKTAVDYKINTLLKIKESLKGTINDALVLKECDTKHYKDILNYNYENVKNNQGWRDKWGFDSWAKSYDVSVRDLRDELNLFDKYDELINTIAEKINVLPKGSRILDIGCGTGNLLGELKEDKELIGIDQSLEMLIIAKNKYPNLTLKLGNFLDESYDDKQVDVIVSTYAFHHLQGKEKIEALDKMVKALSPRGKIIIGDLMFENEEQRQKKKDYYKSIGREDLWDIIEDEYYSDVETLKNYAKERKLKFYYNHVINFTWLIEFDKI